MSHKLGIMWRLSSIDFNMLTYNSFEQARHFEIGKSANFSLKYIQLVINISKWGAHLLHFSLCFDFKSLFSSLDTTFLHSNHQLLAKKSARFQSYFMQRRKNSVIQLKTYDNHYFDKSLWFTDYKVWHMLYLLQCLYVFLYISLGLIFSVFFSFIAYDVAFDILFHIFIYWWTLCPHIFDSCGGYL